MENPKRALAAINTPQSCQVGPYMVREITLGLYGILEAIGSPLYTGTPPATLDGWAPSLYAMTHSAEDSRRILAEGGIDAYTRSAQQWADTIPIALGRRLIDAVTATVRRLNDISPDGREDGAEGNGLAAGPTAG